MATKRTNDDHPETDRASAWETAQQALDAANAKLVACQERFAVAPPHANA